MPTCGAQADMFDGGVDCERPLGHKGKHRANYSTGPYESYEQAANVVVTWEDNPAYEPPKPKRREDMTEMDRQFRDSMARVAKLLSSPVIFNRFGTQRLPAMGKAITFRRLANIGED